MPEENTPSVGEVIRDTQTGKLPIGSVEHILKKAPEDLKEEILEIPEWECSVRMRSLSAAAASEIKQTGFNFEGDNTEVQWGLMEKEQFRRAVIEPKFNEEEVTQLHFTSGLGWARIMKWIENSSTLDRKKLKEAEAEFQESKQPKES
jgi:hypothetical protein